MTRLTDPISTYTVFEENQVLTAGQLNRRMDFLDQQTRLSRARLHGIGVVCGLLPGRTVGRITLGRGTAVTSEGDLLSVDTDLSFARFRPYADADARYPRFRSGDDLLDLYALTNDAADTPLSEFETRTGLSLATVCMVLYLESWRYDPDLCTEGDCDNLGQEQRRALKVLLVDGGRIHDLLPRTPPFLPLFGLLDDLVLPRIVLDGASIGDYSELNKTYANGIKRACDQLKTVLADAYRKSLQAVLGDLYDGSDPVVRWHAALDALSRRVESNLIGIQYVWDHLNDLAAAYTEFREALWEVDAICVPDAAAFPKHVVLGPLDTTEFVPDDTRRHGFYPAPATHPRDRRLDRARFFHQRIDRLITAFSVPGAAAAVRITPSRSAAAPLADRALPYYYKLAGTGSRTLLSRWSYRHTLRQAEIDLYSYHAVEYGDQPHVRAPLTHQLDRCDFLRIEGHLGMPVDDAEKSIRQLIGTHNLPVNLILLQIETGRPVLRPRPLLWSKDLKSLHYLHRRDITRTLGNLKTFTGTVRQTIQAAADLPVKETGDDVISYKAFIDDSASELQTAIGDVGVQLKTDYSAFNYTNFLASYQNTVQKTASINKRVKGVTFNSAFSPYETLVNDTKYEWLDWIDGILKRREAKARELSVFAAFLEAVPAVVHLGGVAPGGTFILVYSQQTGRVVADFSLPYWHCDLPADDVAEEEDLEVADKRDWLNLNTLEIRPSRELVLENRITTLTRDISDLKTDVRLQADNLTLYADSTKTIAETIFKTQADKTATTTKTDTFAAADIGTTAALIDSQTRYIEMVNAKGDAATPEERTMKDQVEKAAGELIKTSMNRAAAGSRDIAPGSDEAKLLESVKSSYHVITSAEVKTDVVKTIRTLADSQRDKPNLVNTIKTLTTR